MKKTLADCFLAPEQFLPESALAVRNSQRLWFIDGRHGKRKHVPLLVAHVDTVRPAAMHGKDVKTGEYIFASGMDDRLGIYLALAVQSMRPHVDVLVTDEEESGRSSACQVTDKEMKKYGCVFNLDRAGLDYVDYDLANEGLKAIIEKHYPAGYGSFSDICDLPEGHCAMANLGTGCQDGHAFGSYVAIADMKTAYNRILAIVDTVADIHFAAPEKLARNDWFSRRRGSRLYSYPGGNATSYSDDYLYCQDNADADKTQYGPALSCHFCGFDLATSYERKEGLCLDCMMQEERIEKAY